MNGIATGLISLITLLISPVGALSQISIIGDLSQDKEARPGDRYDGTIVVRNDTNVPQEAKAYQTDYSFSADGSNSYGEPGTMARSNASWVKFTPSFMTIPPQASVTINYTVDVPPDSSGSHLQGTYWSMMMVEGLPAGSAESALGKKEKKPGMGVQQTIRYGIQIATTIAQTGSRKVRFLGATLLRPEQGKRILQIDIENNGEVGFRSDMYVEVFNAAGTSLGKFPGVKYRMYPGTSVRQHIDLSVLPVGEYKILAVLDAGGDEAFGAQYTLTF